MNSGRFFTKSVKDYCWKWRNIDKKLGLAPPPPLIQKKKKQKSLNSTKDDFEKVSEILEILAELNVTEYYSEREYYSALSTSSDSDF